MDNLNSRVDHDFIMEIVSLFKSWKSEYYQKVEEEKEDLFLGKEYEQWRDNLHEDNRYKRMYEMLSDLNEDEFLDFLTIYYLGRGIIKDFENDREVVKSFGDHPVKKILGKTFLDKYLIKGDGMVSKL